MPKRICGHDARFKHGHPALLVYHINDHLGAFCLLITTVTTLLIRLSSQYYHKSTTLVTSVIRLSSQYYHKGPKRVCCTAQLKHGYPALLAYHIIDHVGASVYKAEFFLPIDPAYKAIYKKKITWGLGRIRTIATPLDRRKATRIIIWGLPIQT